MSFITICMERKNNLTLLPSQRIVISPQQRYSLYMLEMNNLELGEYIKQTMLENPFLKENGDDIIYESSKQRAMLLENIPSKYTYKDEILQHFAFLQLNDIEKNIAFLLVDHITEYRYINNEIVQNISKTKKISYADLLKIIKKLQVLHPAGLFAFNLQDKIRIALENQEKYDVDHKILIQNFSAVLTHGISILKHKHGFDEKRISKIISDVRNVSFNLESCFSDEECQYKIPDVFIRENCEAFINDSTTPAISVDTELHDEMIGKSRSNTDIKYIKEKISSAKIFVKALNDRKSTILKIVREIAYRQQNFLFEKDASLIPISIKSLARSLMLHESTAYRAITNKSVDTPKGIFDLKLLLPHKIKSSDNEIELSDHSIKEYIKKLVTNEPKNSPYTDNNIVNFLNSRGVEISRRTVSKYRSVMEIPNVSQRTRHYKISSICV